MKKLLIVAGLALAAYACSNSGNQQQNEQQPAGQPSAAESAPVNTADDQGIGKFKDVKIDPKLDEQKAAKGQNVYDVKCGSCHKLTDERLVGPGWKGVTQRHRPEWILNFVTNVDEMLNKDPKAQAQLEICLVRMPNQNLTDEDALAVYEYMRKNDGVK
jgi:mono/diheme cytochrome c family protein